MKKIGLFGIIVLIVMIISTATATVTAFATGFEYRVLHNGVNLYADETLSSVSKELKQNDCVEVLEERNIGGNDFYKVKIDDVIGYVDAKYVYATTSKANYQLYTAKAYGNKIGDSINVYATPTAQSEIIRSYIDGTVLTVSKSEVDGYHVVVMEDGVGYVKSENITTSISYNERIALAIALICLVAIILILLITYYRRNIEYFKNKKNSK